MDVFKLDSNFNPSTKVKNFDNLVWTERFVEAGDFVIDLVDDISLLSTLPLGTLISHTDTTEVMIVEDHEIVRTEDKKLKVKVTGRSFEVFADERLTLGTNSPLENISTGARIEDIVTGIPEDLVVNLLRARLQTGYAADGNEIVANLVVRKDILSPDISRTISIQRGSAYGVALELLRVAGAGMKVVRPNGSQTTLDIVIHDGSNLVNSVVFYAQQEDLTDATYFWSIKGYKNYAVVNSKHYAGEVPDRALGSTQTGLNRRMLYVDANDIEGTFGSRTPTDVIGSRGQSELDQHRKLQLMQATVSETARPKFKYDYDVGDLVTVFGEFATSSTMRVTEHILSLDDKGIHGYPSLSSA